MNELIASIDLPLNKWNKNYISPGPVGSVGDVLTSVRIKQSDPDADFAYSKTFAPKNSVIRGSNVQDGQWFSFSDGGYNAEVKKRRLNNGVAFKSDVGWVYKNVVPEDMYVEPKVSSQGRVGFETQAAAILHRSGDMFKELPGGYSSLSGVLPRGNQYPRNVSLQTNIDVYDNAKVTDKVFDYSKPVLPPTKKIIDSVVESSLYTAPNVLSKGFRNLVPTMIDLNYQ